MGPYGNKGLERRMNMKTVLFLVGDYWHHAETIQPLAAKLFPEENWTVTFTENPKELLTMSEAPDLIVSFKDPIENDQIPTPIWCDQEWTDRLFADVCEHGTGLMLIHAAVTDLESDHPIVKEMIQSVFTGHPEQCPLTFKGVREHAIMEGVTEFTFPENDEHYMMSMLDDAQVEIIAQTQSKNGVQPGMWVKEAGKGKVCCITPGHTTKNLICEEYLKVLQNAVAWCSR